MKQIDLKFDYNDLLYLEVALRLYKSDVKDVPELKNSFKKVSELHDKVSKAIAENEVVKRYEDEKQ